MIANRPRSMTIAALPSYDVAIDALLSLTNQQRPTGPSRSSALSPSTVLCTPEVEHEDPSSEYGAFKVSKQELEEIQAFASILRPANRRRAFFLCFLEGSSGSSNALTTKGFDSQKFTGIYSPRTRRKRVERYLLKRKSRVWSKKIKYNVRKNFADSRLRVKGRFVKKEDETLLRDLMEIC